MINRVLGRLFDRLGPDYPYRAASTILLGGHLVVFAGAILVAYQFHFTARQFWTTVLLMEIAMTVDNAISVYAIGRALRLVRSVLAEEVTDTDSVVRAWRRLVGLPTRHFRRATQRTTVIILIPVCTWLTVDLHTPWWGAFVMFGAGLIVMLYGYLLRFFIFEVAFRPPVEWIATRMGDTVVPRAAAFSVQSKLLFGLPLINLITGLAVASLSRNDGVSGLTNVGFDVVIALAVATTVSLGLSLLMSRSLLLPIADIRRAAKAARGGDLQVRVPVTTADEIGVLADGFNRLMVGMEQRARLEEALGEYVDPTVAAAVVAENEEHLGGQEVDLTVMFVDIRGFTSFAERAAPRAVVNRLNNFFEIVIPAIVRHGGQANKFTGDGLLALFGAPEQLPNHADKALDAALDIVTLLRTRFAGQLEVGIGINSGPAVAGTIGGGGKSDFTVIGDTVNTAERVERATRQTGDPILLAGSTHSRLTRDHGGFDERPSVPMQGKQHQVRLWTPRILDALSGLTAGNLGNVAAAAAGPLIGDELGDGVTVERFESD